MRYQYTFKMYFNYTYYFGGGAINKNNNNNKNLSYVDLTILAF